MQVIIHAGAHCTDEDKLLRTLLRNADLLRAHGTAVPGPSRYRTLLSEVLHGLSEGEPQDDAREAFLDAVLDDQSGVDRLVLSHNSLFSVPKLALAGGTLYRRAEERTVLLRDLFPDDAITLCLGMRDIATFVPALHAATPHQDLDTLLDGADPLSLRWSDLLARLRAVAPDIGLTVWCNEDTPVLWGSLIREIGGLDPEQQILGAFDLFGEIVDPEGMRRFRAFMRDNPQVREAHKRRLMGAFLEKYALDEAVEEEFDLPGWDADLMDALSEDYDADIQWIAEMEGVRLHLP